MARKLKINKDTKLVDIVLKFTSELIPEFYYMPEFL